MLANKPLIEAARQGDREALERLIAVSQPDIRRFARSQCAPSDADDAVQETLLLVYRRIGGLRTVAAFPAWVFAIVQRECRRMLRRMFHRSDPLPEETIPEFVERPEPVLRLSLLEAIHSLPDKYREVIVLRDVEEFTIGEIATELMLTREAVKSRIHRGRRMIREYLED